MLVTLGDLVDDVVVRIGGPLRPAADTPSVVRRRRGGSAANTAAAAARLGAHSRFIGRVGDDAIGTALVAELAAEGVDVAFVQHHGTSGTIVVLVDPSGERSMLTDRGACTELDSPTPAWLDGATALHLPLYSFTADPLATTATRTARLARERGILLSLDLSSVTVLDEMGRDSVATLVTDLGPDVVIANADEAAWFGVDRSIGSSVTIVKRGPDPATVHAPDGSATDVPAVDLGAVGDTTGAGDAFAAGYLVAATRSDALADPVAACAAGHRAAADTLRSR